jgi:hypothetical protein
MDRKALFRATAVIMFEQTDELEHDGQCRVRVRQRHTSLP